MTPSYLIDKHLAYKPEGYISRTEVINRYKFSWADFDSAEIKDCAVVTKVRGQKGLFFDENVIRFHILLIRIKLQKLV